MSVVLTLLITPHLEQIIWGIKNDIARTHLCICASNSAVRPGYKYKCVYNVQIKIMYNVQTQVILQGHANMHFSSSDNTKLEAFCIVTIYSFCQENMPANRYVWF